MLFSYVSNFILDDVYGAYAFLVCIPFYTGRCVWGGCFVRMYQILYSTMYMGPMLFSYVSHFILDDVYGVYTFLVHVCINFILDDVSGAYAFLVCIPF